MNPGPPSPPALTACDALEAALREEAPRLRRFLGRLCGNRADADDLVQDVMERALRYRARFDPSRSAGAWLRRIAFRVFLDRRARTRTAAGVRELLGDRDAFVVDGACDATRLAEARDEVERILEPLGALERDIIQRFHARGESLADIASALELPVGTVKSHLHRARSRMRARRTDNE